MEELSEQELGGWSSGPVQAGEKVGGEGGGVFGIGGYCGPYCGV